MLRFFFLSFFIISLLSAEDSLQKLNLLTIEGEEAIKSYREHAKIQYKLRQALYEHQHLLKEGGEETEVLKKNIPILQKQLISVEKQMHKLYGMIPGLTYGSKVLSADLVLLCDNKRLRQILGGEGAKMKPSDILDYVEEVDENGEVTRLNRVRLAIVEKEKDLELLQTMLSYGKDLKLHLSQCQKALAQEKSAERKEDLKKLLRQLMDKRIKYGGNLKSLYGVGVEDKLEAAPRRLEVFLYATLGELKSMALLPSTQKRLLETLKP